MTHTNANTGISTHSTSNWTSHSLFISGTGSAYPTDRLTNLDFKKTIPSIDPAWIVARSGIHERRISSPSNRFPNLSLAFEAAKKAITAANIDAQNIDLILCATSTPDQWMPSLACHVQRKLEIKNCVAFDINAASSGYIAALKTAMALAKSGEIRSALIIGSEVLSKVTDFSDPNTGILFGDGAGATVFTSRPVSNAVSNSGGPISTTHETKLKQGLFAATFESDGRGVPMLEIAPVLGSLENADSKPGKIVMRGKEIFKQSVLSMADSVRNICKENGVTFSEVSHVVAHQANIRILDALSKRLEIPLEKFTMTLDHSGNTSAASIPSALDSLVRENGIKKGELILFTAFGAGTTWGSALYRHA